jgi:hypothetical protein
LHWPGLVNGKIVETCAVWDRLAFLQQLGIGEAPALARADS